VGAFAHRAPTKLLAVLPDVRKPPSRQTGADLFDDAGNENK